MNCSVWISVFIQFRPAFECRSSRSRLALPNGNEDDQSWLARYGRSSLKGDRHPLLLPKLLLQAYTSLDVWHQLGILSQKHLYSSTSSIIWFGGHPLYPKTVSIVCPDNLYFRRWIQLLKQYFRKDLRNLISSSLGVLSYLHPLGQVVCICLNPIRD